MNITVYGDSILKGVLLEDGSCRYMDVNGNMLGPTEGYWQYLYE